MRFTLVSLAMLFGLAAFGSCGTKPRGLAGLPVPGGEGKRVGWLLLGDAREVLEQADSFELLSLEPRRGPRRPEDPPRLPERFHEYRVLGRVEVPLADRWQLLEALYAGVNEGPDMGAGCWEPRHGIHATRGERTVDLLICFKCIAVRVVGLQVPEDPKRRTKKISTTRAPEPAFDAVLRKFGLPKSGPWAD
ncbi:MAG: hypothetical protein P1V36_03470 [Planctomycetota bacterium]|nr:hypothetical protein [Planctomycetota bacterium]